MMELYHKSSRNERIQRRIVQFYTSNANLGSMARGRVDAATVVDSSVRSGSLVELRPNLVKRLSCPESQPVGNKPDFDYR
jgi:hypothetical protein